MANKDIIASKFDPKIPLKELWMGDNSEPSLQNPFFKVGKSGREAADMIGADFPLVKINSIPIDGVSQLIIDETRLIPRIKMIFKDSMGAISGPHYPKNNPIVSVYMKTQNPGFKPIRCDFLITSIKSDQDVFDEPDPKRTEFILTGELYIPKIYSNTSKSYRKSTSIEALSQLAQDLDLGYANNEFTTDDKMTWINPNRDYAYMIDHITKHAYSDDDSFFRSFIDKYYHLNFIEVTEQLNLINEKRITLDNTIDANSLAQNRDIKEKGSDKSNMEDSRVILKLTNDPDIKGKIGYIEKYAILGDNGRILKKKGYKRKIYYYDHTIDGEKFVSFYVKPVSVEGYKDSKLTSLIPDDKELRESLSKKWMNIDYGNTHREWNAAVLINDHNNSELDKIKLKIMTPGINFQVSRGMGIPVSVMLPSADHIKQNILRKDKRIDVKPIFPITNDTYVIDSSISGRYYVSGVKYIYDSSERRKFNTEYYLTRMNWLGEKNIIEEGAA